MAVGPSPQSHLHAYRADNYGVLQIALSTRTNHIAKNVQ